MKKNKRQHFFPSFFLNKAGWKKREREREREKRQNTELPNVIPLMFWASERSCVWTLELSDG